MSALNEPHSETLTRDQLIAALEKEIADTAALQASTGRSKWVILVTLAALFGFSIKAWGQSSFSLYCVVALSLAMCAAWDFTRVLLRALDASPATGYRPHNKFFVISDLLGTFRSTLFVYIVRESLIVVGAFWLASPQVAVFKYFSIFILAGLCMGFLTSYASVAVPGDASRLRHPVQGLGALTFIGNLAAAGSIIVFTWSLRHRITATDVQLAASVAAASYLVLWLAQENIPDTRLQQLRHIRQNLSFARISLEDAQNQTEFLLVGQGIAHLLGRPFENVIRAIEKVRAVARAADSQLQDYQKSWGAIRESNGAVLPMDLAESALTRAHLLLGDLTAEYEKCHDSLRRKVKDFSDRCAILTFFSPGAEKDAAPLLEKLCTEIAPFEKHLKSLKDSIEEQKKILASWRSSILSNSVETRILHAPP